MRAEGDKAVALRGRGGNNLVLPAFPSPRLPVSVPPPLPLSPQGCPPQPVRVPPQGDSPVPLSPPPPQARSRPQRPPNGGRGSARQCEQIVAPPDRVAHRPVAVRRIPRPTRQHRNRRANRGSIAAAGEEPARGRRQSIASGNPSGRRQIAATARRFVGYRKIFVGGRARSPKRRTAPNSRVSASDGSLFGSAMRGRHLDIPLAGDVQHRPARHQHRRPGRLPASRPTPPPPATPARSYRAPAATASTPGRRSAAPSGDRAPSPAPPTLGRSAIRPW